MPACIRSSSLVAREDVPLAISWESSTATERPRNEASSAMPSPVAPPPTTIRSNSSCLRRANVVVRCAEADVNEAGDNEDSSSDTAVPFKGTLKQGYARAKVRSSKGTLKQRYVPT